MFLQIHTLTSYHATLLNRDDAGLAKRIPFGDQPRLRVSSQCLKRHWRMALQNHLDLPFGLRTRHFFEREILGRLVNERGLPENTARDLTETLVGLLLQKSDKPKAGPAKRAKKPAAAEPELDLGENPENDVAASQTQASGLQVKQPILFGKPEADFLVGLLAQCAAEGSGAKQALQAILKKDKANFTALLRQAGHGNLFAGVEGALFGRFVTSDILARADAAVHVAHAFSVHALDTEVDYFTVVDDLNRDEETGAAHAGDMELGSGVFYGYVAVDIPLLVSNFTGCDANTWRDQNPTQVRATLHALARAITTVTPGAKLGATAPYAYSDFLLLETGGQQPRSLANAFLKSIKPRDDLIQQGINALATHLTAQEGMFGPTADLRTLATTGNWPHDQPRPQPLDQAVGQILDAIFGAEPHASATPTL